MKTKLYSKSKGKVIDQKCCTIMDCFHSISLVELPFFWLLGWEKSSSKEKWTYTIIYQIFSISLSSIYYLYPQQSHHFVGSWFNKVWITKYARQECIYGQLSPIMDTIHQEPGPTTRLYSFFTLGSAKPRKVNLIRSNYVTIAMSIIRI